MVMSFYLAQDRYDQDQFSVKWKPGDKNLGNYFIKHHPLSHHKRMWSMYLANKIKNIQRSIMRGCINLTNKY